MLVGAVTSGCSIAVSEYSKDDNMFQLTPSGSAVESISSMTMHSVYASLTRTRVLLPHSISVRTNWLQKVAVIYNSSDVYSSGIYNKFAAEAANQPFEIVSAEAFTADSKTDFSVQLQKAKDAGADLVFLPIYYTEASLILSQADKYGLCTTVLRL